MKWQSPLEEVQDARIGDETELHSLTPCEQRTRLLHCESQLLMWLSTCLVRHLRNLHALTFAMFVTMGKMLLIKPTQIFKKDISVKGFIYKIQTNVCELLHEVDNPLDQPALC